MPIKLNVGLSKKVGQPDYGSLGATCNIEVELDTSLMQGNVEALHRHIRAVYLACAQAVQEELTRQGSGPTTVNAASRQAQGEKQGAQQLRTGTPVANRTSRVNGQNPRQASKKQAEYARQLAHRIEGLGLRGLEELTNRMFGKQFGDLSSLEASGLIETLKDLDTGKIDVLAALKGAAA